VIERKIENTNVKVSAKPVDFWEAPTLIITEDDVDRFNIERVHVESSQIASIGYDPKTQTLEVEFNHEGAVYRYVNVPADVYQEIMSADSVGSAFGKLIKKNAAKYPFTCVG
jgi:hypothetical protein